MAAYDAVPHKSPVIPSLSWHSLNLAQYAPQSSFTALKTPQSIHISLPNIVMNGGHLRVEHSIRAVMCIIRKLVSCPEMSSLYTTNPVLLKTCSTSDSEVDDGHQRSASKPCPRGFFCPLGTMRHRSSVWYPGLLQGWQMCPSVSCENTFSPQEERILPAVLGELSILAWIDILHMHRGTSLLSDWNWPLSVPPEV